MGQGEDLDPASVFVPEAVQDGSMELYEQVRQRIVRPAGLFFLGKGLIGFPDLSTRAHLALGLMYERKDLGHMLVEFPKSHLKTTLGTVTNTLHTFASLAIKGEDLWERVGVASNTKTNAKRFLRLIKSHIAHYGAIELDQLYETPFTTIHSEGVDGVFTDQGQVDDLLGIIATFETGENI